MSTSYTELVRRILAREYWMALNENDLPYVDLCEATEVEPYMTADAIAIRRLVLAEREGIEA